MNADAADSAAPEDDAASAATAAEDVKDKFRQALENKRGHQADREAASGQLGGSKIGGEHASAKTKRTFRRKSG